MLTWTEKVLFLTAKVAVVNNELEVLYCNFCCYRDPRVTWKALSDNVYSVSRQTDKLDQCRQGQTMNSYMHRSVYNNAPQRGNYSYALPTSCTTCMSDGDAWWGFTNAADKQRLEASVRRAIRLGLYTADDPTPSQLVADMDANILNNPHHVLHKFLPRKTDHSYNLRSRRHSLSLTVKTDCNNFLNRLLFKDIY